MVRAKASMGSPASEIWCRRAGAPVSTMRRISPPARWISARSASTSMVPWRIFTLPSRTETLSSSSSASVWSAVMSIGWSRSLDLAAAGAASSRARGRSRLAATGRISAFDIVEELEALGLHVHPQAGAAQYRFAVGDGHPIIGAGFPPLREHRQQAGVEAAAQAGGAGRADHVHVLARLQVLAAGADPGGARACGPAAVLARETELRLLQQQRAGARFAEQVRAGDGEGFLAGLVQGDQLVVAQHVLGAVAGRRWPVVAQGQAPGHQADQHHRAQAEDDVEPGPVHFAPKRARMSPRRPRASSSRSQNSRTAPAPPAAWLRQCTRSATQGWALAGAAARPAMPMA